MPSEGAAPPTLRSLVHDRLRRVRGVVVSPSMFGAGDAYWCNGKEIAHFENESVLEVRLTQGEIRERREELKADRRVELRPSGADWLTVRLASSSDVAFALALVRVAARAHRPSDGR